MKENCIEIWTAGGAMETFVVHREQITAMHCRNATSTTNKHGIATGN